MEEFVRGENVVMNHVFHYEEERPETNKREPGNSSKKKKKKAQRAVPK